MAERSVGAVAVDMGASSARLAAGWVENGRIRFEIVSQIAHEACGGKWDYAKLAQLCHDAVSYAQQNFERATVGIDTWGVDHGFLDGTGKLVQNPICYRDDSHVRMYEDMVGHRRRLFELTGIQHQPFNTIYQLAARSIEHKDWPTSVRWQLLPDLFGHELSKRLHYEYTQASTTQLMGLDGKWCEEAFELAGWPVPIQQPRMPGHIIGHVAPGVELASVASHDTASAVCGLGRLNVDDVFLNIGTWSLLGTVIDAPLVSRTAEDGGWTNERTHDGRVRLLKNIPGFYIVNRLHDEVGDKPTVGEWIESADLGFEGSFDYFHKSLYNPDRMSAEVLERTTKKPTKSCQWAGMAIKSMADATVEQPSKLGEIVGRQFTRIRIAGGGSQSQSLCQLVADGTGLQVVAGPVEATVLGNLAMQLVALKEIEAMDLETVIEASTETRTYEPGGSL